LKKEELLGIVVEHRHVKLVQYLSKMHDVNVNVKTIHIWHAVNCLGDWTPNNARLTDQENKFSDHIVFLRPIASAARMGNAEMVNEPFSM